MSADVIDFVMKEEELYTVRVDFGDHEVKFTGTKGVDVTSEDYEYTLVDNKGALVLIPKGNVRLMTIELEVPFDV